MKAVRLEERLVQGMSRSMEFIQQPENGCRRERSLGLQGESCCPLKRDLP